MKKKKYFVASDFQLTRILKLVAGGTICLYFYHLYYLNRVNYVINHISQPICSQFLLKYFYFTTV